MNDKPEVVSIWKALGQTMGELVEQYRKEKAIDGTIPITYAGRLDPMAEGVVILLIGDAVHRKEEFLSLTKEYTFECLWGIETDTYDILGLVKNELSSTLDIDISKIESVAKNFIGKQREEYPPYSSKPVNGKPLFQWSREGRINEIEIPKKEIEIYSLDVVSHKKIQGHELLKNIEEKIGLVHGDFRQSEIVSHWQEGLRNHKENTFYLTLMKAKVSSGTYVRSLVHEIGKVLGIKGTTFHIERNRVGDFEM